MAGARPGLESYDLGVLDDRHVLVFRLAPGVRHVLDDLDGRTVRYVQHLGLVEVRHQTEVKLDQVFHHRKMRGPDAGRMGAGVALVDLLLGQGEQKAVIAEVGLGGVFRLFAALLHKGR